MKNKIQIFFLVCFVFGTINIEESVGSSLPKFLPIGDQYPGWIITNQPCCVEMMMQYKGINGGMKSFGLIKDNESFCSYEICKKTLLDYSNWLLSFVRKQEDAHVAVRLYVRLTYPDGSGFKINTDIGLVSEVNTLSLSNFVSRPSQILMLVDGLDRFAFEISNNIVPSGLEMVTNIIVFDKSSQIVSNRMRFILTSKDGERAVYTQTGDLIIPPTVSIIDQGELVIGMTSGSDTVIEQTYNLVDWATLEVFSWSFRTNIGKVLLNPNNEASPRGRFFRAYSW